MISYSEAKTILNKEFAKGNIHFTNDSFVHFYIDDQKFDGFKTGIWHSPKPVLDLLKHFKGAITPDFSTYEDFPDALKRWNTYRMRAFGYWLGQNKIPIINNVRWGDTETWNYCFDGLPKNSVLCIGTVASGLKLPDNRSIFNQGILELIRRLAPKALLI